MKIKYFEYKMEDQNSPILTHAKMEYTNQLIDILTPHFFDGIFMMKQKQLIMLIGSNQYYHYSVHFWNVSLHGVMLLLRLKLVG